MASVESRKVWIGELGVCCVAGSLRSDRTIPDQDRRFMGTVFITHGIEDAYIIPVGQRYVHIYVPSPRLVETLAYDRFFLVLVLVPVAEVVATRMLRLVFAFCGEISSGEGEPRDDVVDSLEDLRTTFSSCATPCF